MTLSITRLHEKYIEHFTNIKNWGRTRFIRFKWWITIRSAVTFHENNHCLYNVIERSSVALSHFRSVINVGVNCTKYHVICPADVELNYITFLGHRRFKLQIDWNFVCPFLFKDKKKQLTWYAYAQKYSAQATG